MPQIPNIQTATIQSPPGISKKKKKKHTGRKVLIILLVIFSIIGCGMYFNRYRIAKVVKKVPVANQIFKEKPLDPLEGYTKEQLIKQVKTLTKEIEDAGIKMEGLENEKILLEDKIRSLKQYELQYNNFIEQKNAWDAEVAATNPELFITQFEATYKDTADNIYENLKTSQILSKEQKRYATTIAEMDATKAALALTKVVSTDPELIKVIFEHMEVERKADILSAMDSTTAAQVIKLVSPTVNE